MFCENCGHQISDTAKFCSACGHPVGTAPSPGVGAPPTVPAKRESPRLKASSGNGSITRMSGTRRKPWLLRMPIPDPHTGITAVSYTHLDVYKRQFHVTTQLISGGILV